MYIYGTERKIFINNTNERGEKNSTFTRGSKNRPNFEIRILFFSIYIFLHFLAPSSPVCSVLCRPSIWILIAIVFFFQVYRDGASVDEEFANRIDSRFVPGVGVQKFLSRTLCNRNPQWKAVVNPRN